MPIYLGGCHCGAVRVTITKDAPIDRLIDCNCSVCTMKGILHCPVEDHEITVDARPGALRLYQFGTASAEHRFCGDCGIHVFGRPRSNPRRHTVNARCLDDFETVRARVEIVCLDGRNHPKDRC